MICVEGWGVRGKVCFLNLSQLHWWILSSKRDGGCMAILAVPGAHRHTLKAWVAQINERDPTVCV